MIIFEDFVISDDIIKEKFSCNLSKCKGACCIHGDTGAPLLPEELSILDDIFDDIKDFMPEENAREVEKNGKYVIDFTGETVTPLVNGEQCAYVYFNDEGIALCAIEKAYNEGLITFRKPVSCFLYPIRVSKLKNYTALNYHQWEICRDARILGSRKNTTVLSFLKIPIIENFGPEMFETLSQVKL